MTRRLKKTSLWQKYIPSRQEILKNKYIQKLGPRLTDPRLWSLTRKSVAWAVAVGLFWALVPLPLQMLGAAVFCCFFRGNIPIAVALTWISNPFTMGPLIYMNYIIGMWVLPASTSSAFTASWEWVSSQAGSVFTSIFIGAIILGLLLGVFGYFGVLFAWRVLVFKRMRSRKIK